MILPEEIKVGGLIYKVIITDGLADSGSTNFDRQIILINESQIEERKQSALIHEIIEVFNEMGDLDLKHQTIQTLESFVYQLLKDNKL